VIASDAGETARSDMQELAAALVGDQDAFQRLVEPHRRELHLHCYRLLGSMADAEDAVQETMLRAWRSMGSFEGRSAFRAWLYRIATNVCLTRGVRRRPEPARPPLLAKETASASADEPAINLSPYPDDLLDQIEAPWGDPAAIYDLRESVQVAFLAAVQLLPPRQRAVLILHDVLGWSLREVARALDATVASVNGALGRARTHLDAERASGRLRTNRVVPSSELEQSLVQRYVEAWQAADTAALAAILKDDVVLTMPPRPLRYVGRQAVAEFYDRVPFATGEQFHFVAARANRQPAVALYRLDSSRNKYVAGGMWVLTLDGDFIAEITAFVDPTLLPSFGLPAELQASQGASQGHGCSETAP
jgi:RNA polymerase sigma-70 factor (ECF subfamily)